MTDNDNTKKLSGIPPWPVHSHSTGKGNPMAATDHSDNKAIGQRLQFVRDRYGISQSAAARFAGMSLKKWRELERGDSAINWYDPLRSDLPTLRSVFTFVHRCGLSLEWVIAGDERFAPEPIRHRPRLVAVGGKRVA